MVTPVTMNSKQTSSPRRRWRLPSVEERKDPGIGLSASRLIRIFELRGMESQMQASGSLPEQVALHRAWTSNHSCPTHLSFTLSLAHRRGWSYRHRYEESLWRLF